MYSLRGIVQFSILVIFSTQPIFSKIIRFNDDGTTYEYNNSSKPLGKGAFSKVYEGIRTEGNQTESVVFKECYEIHENLLHEANICSIVSDNDSFPKFYRYFPETNETKAVFVMERIGKSLFDLWNEFRPFSVVTTARIGLEILNAAEWMHGIGITHNDLHIQNIAVGYRNKSKLYIYDFSLGRKKKSWQTPDLWFVAQNLNTLIQTNFYDEYYEQNNAFKQFSQIAGEFRSISDDALRNETYGKLRSILMTELESHKSDADYEKCNIGYVQDAVDSMSQLQRLIKRNDTSAIENLIKSDQGLNINAGFGNSSYHKPIHLAAGMGNPRMVQLFIDHGAEVNTKYNDTHYAMSPLHYAAIGGHVGVIEVLCEHGAEINAKILNGRTPLHLAVLQSNAEVVRILCERGADVNIRDNNGKTPLCIAADYDRVDVIRILIEHGAETDIKTTAGIAPRYSVDFYANRNHDEHGAQTVTKSSSGNTPLYDAIRFGFLNLSILLIENGAKTNFKYPDNNTPLHYAAEYGYMDLVRFLCERGADINAKSDFGIIPLHYAVQNERVNITQFLIEHGADINAKENRGQTPLHLAAMTGSTDLVHFLIEHGADMKAKDNQGKTPLDNGIENGSEKLINILREAEQKSAV